MTVPLTSDSAPPVLGVELKDVNFAYPGCPAFLKGCSIALPRGSRCLLVGANGAGKSTLLQIVAGKYMVGKEVCTVLGRPPFHDMALTCSGQLSYLGTSWRKDVAFAGYGVQMSGDISAGKMIFGVEGVDPARRSRLVELLDVDVHQRLTTMSDGQRRRVQICMGLLLPYEVLLLDEITVDLDVVGRLSLLDFFKAECEERGATIVYATHIFDGMAGWLTHMAYMEDGEVVRGGPRESLPDLSPEAGGSSRKLLHVAEGWLLEERTRRHARLAAKAAAIIAAGGTPDDGTGAVVPQRTPVMGMMSSKHLAFFR